MFQGILCTAGNTLEQVSPRNGLLMDGEAEPKVFKNTFPRGFNSRSWVQDSNLKNCCRGYLGSPQQSSLVIILATLAPTECALPPGLIQGGDAVDSKKLLGVCIANRNSNPERSPNFFLVRI